MASENDIREIIGETVKSLISHDWLNKDGGWGSKSGDASNLWSTCQITLLINHILNDKDLLNITGKQPDGKRQSKTLDVIRNEGLAYIENLLASQISHDEELTRHPLDNLHARKQLNPVSIAFAVEILAAEENDKISFCIEYLRNTQGKDGGWCIEGDINLESSGITTCIVCLSLMSVKLKSDYFDLRAAIFDDVYAFFNTRSIQQNNSLAWPDKGNKSDIRATCYTVYTLRKVWGDDHLAIPGGRYIRENQHRNGSWGKQDVGDVEDTSWAIGALLSVNSHPKSRHIQKALDYIVKQFVFTPNKTFFGCQPISIRSQLSDKVSTPATFYAMRALFWYMNSSNSENVFSYFIRSRWNMMQDNLTNILLILIAIIGLFLLYLQLNQTPNIVYPINVIAALLMFFVPIVAILLRQRL